MTIENQANKGRVRRTIIIVCGVLLTGGIALQWRNTRTSPVDDEVEQQQLAAVPSQAGAFESPKPNAELRELEGEKRELLRLRNEVRQLREQANRANGESATADVASAAVPNEAPSPIAPIQRTGLPPEWKGMEEHATNTYVRALEQLGNANTEMQRFFALGDAAKLSFAFGQTEHAQGFATELLALGEKFKGEPWSGKSGDAVHAGNLVLGRLALEAGAVEDAKRYLLAAGTSSGSPVLGSFGPNMSLARELLERGERETVLQYFEGCAQFWKTEKLQQWTDEINAGRIPSFGANLIY